MLTEAIMFKIILSFIIAGVWITFATIASERFGTKIGGLIGNLPSNIVVSLFFIGWTQTAEIAADAAHVVPLGMTIDAIFLFALILLVKKYRNLAFLFALIVWFVLAALVGTSGYSDMTVGSIVYVAISLVLFYIAEKKLNIISVPKKTNISYSAGELLIRAIFAGTVVAGAVTITALAGPNWGGIFSTFPAVMLSTMYLLTRAQGADFARATGKVMLIASLNILVYAIAVSITYPIYGLVVGTIISYVCAVIFVVLFSPLLKRIK
jgi:hypothetical protein